MKFWRLEPWGPDGIRVRATRLPEIKQDWINALLPRRSMRLKIEIGETGASLRNGSIVAKVNHAGILSFVNADSGNVLLREQPYPCPIDPGQTL